MLNNNAINTNYYNSSSGLSVSTSSVTVSSFGSTRTQKYSFQEAQGSIFNFWNIESGIQYGNYVVSTNIEDIADTDIITTINPMRNGWTIKNKTFTQKNIDFTLKIVSDSFNNIETEIQNIKKSFQKWKIYKQENNRESYIDVECIDIKTERISNNQNTINISFISLSPFFIDINSTTKFYENQNNSISGNIVISDTEIEPNINGIIYFKTLTWVINTLTLELNWYPITINETINNGDILYIDADNTRILHNNIEVQYTGQFMPFPIWVNANISLTYWWGGSIADYSLYLIYNKKYY